MDRDEEEAIHRFDLGASGEKLHHFKNSSNSFLGGGNKSALNINIVKNTQTNDTSNTMKITEDLDLKQPEQRKGGKTPVRFIKVNKAKF